MNHQNFAKPQGLLVFPTLTDAVRNGFHFFEKRNDGCIVQARTDAGWAFALVRAEEGNRLL